MRALLVLCLLLVSLPAMAQKPADDPSFRLHNDGAAPITELFATPSGRANWGRSRLDGTPIEPRGERLIRLPRDGDCVYDLRVVFAGGHTLTRRGTNLCRVGELHAP
jgi:hypothetical protein